MPHATSRVVSPRRAGWACKPAERKPGSQFTTCPAGPGTCALAERGKPGSRSTMRRQGLRAGLNQILPLYIPPFFPTPSLLPCLICALTPFLPPFSLPSAPSILPPCPHLPACLPLSLPLSLLLLNPPSPPCPSQLGLQCGLCHCSATVPMQ